METQANDGGGYGLVSVMPTLSSKGNALVYATGLEPLSICYDKSSTHLCPPEVEYAANGTLDTSL